MQLPDLPLFPSKFALHSKYVFPITPNLEPDQYEIDSISYAYPAISEEILEVRMTCCGTGDIAYINKTSNEVIGFSPGDK